MDLWKYLSLLARPSLWERKCKGGQFEKLWLKDGSAWIYPTYHGVTLHDPNFSDIYSPNPLAHLLFVTPLAIILNHRVP